MSRFIENAAKLLDAAETALQAGQVPSDMTILVSSTGGIRMIADSDWPLDSLRTHHGADMAYRITEHRHSVRIEGRSGTNKCLLETPKPAQTARLLLGGYCATASVTLS